MSATTAIQWCDATFNPWIGCTKVSPGCAHCYAEHQTPVRVHGVKWGKGQQRRRTSEASWNQVRTWNRLAELRRSHETPLQRPRVFCASLADWLDEEVPIGWLADLLKLIHDTPNLDWLMLTKRPENFWKRVPEAFHHMYDPEHRFPEEVCDWLAGWITDPERAEAPANVWFGVSVEDQVRAEERIPVLLKIPARVRFLSCEPLLGPVEVCKARYLQMEVRVRKTAERLLHWVIVGGESGPKARKARTCHMEWIRSVVGQCRAAGVAPFVKQLGSDARHGALCHGPNHGAHPLMLKHPKGGDIEEWPEELQVREFPDLRWATNRTEKL